MPNDDPNKFIRHTNEYSTRAETLYDRARIVGTRQTTPEEGFKKYVTGAAEDTARRTAFESNWSERAAMKNNKRDHKNPFARGK